MAKYRIRIKTSAVKEIERIANRSDRRRVVSRIQALADDPRPRGCEKLSGQDRYRIRQGVYRIVYSVEDDQLIVHVVRVGLDSLQNLANPLTEEEWEKLDAEGCG